jgi:hypothetical protein
MKLTWYSARLHRAASQAAYSVDYVDVPSRDPWVKNGQKVHHNSNALYHFAKKFLVLHDKNFAFNT